MGPSSHGGGEGGNEGGELEQYLDDPQNQELLTFFKSKDPAGLTQEQIHRGRLEHLPKAEHPLLKVLLDLDGATGTVTNPVNVPRDRKSGDIFRPWVCCQMDHAQFAISSACWDKVNLESLLLRHP